MGHTSAADARAFDFASSCHGPSFPYLWQRTKQENRSTSFIELRKVSKSTKQRENPRFNTAIGLQCCGQLRLHWLNLPWLIDWLLLRITRTSALHGRTDRHHHNCSDSISWISLLYTLAIHTLVCNAYLSFSNMHSFRHTRVSIRASDLRKSRMMLNSRIQWSHIKCPLLSHFSTVIFVDPGWITTPGNSITMHSTLSFFGITGTRSRSIPRISDSKLDPWYAMPWRQTHCGNSASTLRNSSVAQTVSLRIHRSLDSLLIQDPIKSLITHQGITFSLLYDANTRGPISWNAQFFLPPFVKMRHSLRYSFSISEKAKIRCGAIVALNPEFYLYRLI